MTCAVSYRMLKTPTVRPQPLQSGDWTTCLSNTFSAMMNDTVRPPSVFVRTGLPAASLPTTIASTAEQTALSSSVALNFGSSVCALHQFLMTMTSEGSLAARSSSVPHCQPPHDPWSSVGSGVAGCGIPPIIFGVKVGAGGGGVTALSVPPVPGPPASTVEVACARAIAGRQPNKATATTNRLNRVIESPAQRAVAPRPLRRERNVAQP